MEIKISLYSIKKEIRAQPKNKKQGVNKIFISTKIDRDRDRDRDQIRNKDKDNKEDKVIIDKT